MAWNDQAARGAIAAGTWGGQADHAGAAGKWANLRQRAAKGTAEPLAAGLKPRLMDRGYFAAALNTAGVPWRWGHSQNHFNVVPVSNLKPWTPGQQNVIEEAVRSVGGYVT